MDEACLIILGLCVGDQKSEHKHRAADSLDTFSSPSRRGIDWCGSDGKHGFIQSSFMVFDRRCSALVRADRERDIV